MLLCLYAVSGMTIKMLMKPNIGLGNEVEMKEGGELKYMYICHYS